MNTQNIYVPAKNIIIEEIGEEIINDDIISALKKGFQDKETYYRHLGVLWTLRDIVYSRLEIRNFEENSDYTAFHTLNSLISILLANTEISREFIKQYQL
jgi:hypothetical protein